MGSPTKDNGNLQPRRPIWLRWTRSSSTPQNQQEMPPPAYPGPPADPLMVILDAKLEEAMTETKMQAQEEIERAFDTFDFLKAEKEREQNRPRFPRLQRVSSYTYSSREPALIAARSLHFKRVGRWTLRREIAIMSDYNVRKREIEQGMIGVDTVDAWNLGGVPEAMPRFEDAVELPATVMSVSLSVGNPTMNFWTTRQASHKAN
ncbi:hypothetical protein OQA88_11023 [Cercophora sp. LCS_1]